MALSEYSNAVPTPAPKPGEVLVRVQARPVQPADFMFIEGRYRIIPQWPQTAGLEGAGPVVAVGKGVAMRLNTRVAFRFPGSWAEFITVPVERAYIVPDGVPIESAAQFALNPVTAWALLDELRVQGGDWIVVNAATSAIAQLVHHLAKLRGIGVVGLVRAGSKADLRFPAIAADTPDLSAQIVAATGGASAAGCLDSVGGPVVRTVFGALRPGAIVVSYGVLGQTPVQIFNADLIYRNLTWKGFGIDHWLETSKGSRLAMESDLWAAIIGGNLPMPVRATFRREDFVQSLTAARQAGAGGKVLISG